MPCRRMEVIEHIRNGARSSYQTDMRRMIILEQSGVKASGGETRQIGAKQEHHREREEPCQKRKEKCSENIREESEKSSAEHSVSISIVQNNAERG